MADAGWLLDVVKVIGGGIGGAAVKAWSDRWRLRRTRRLLYKELAYNYGVLHVELHDGEHTDLMKGRVPNFSFEYYLHAKQDLDAFHTLEESQLLNGIYKHLQSITDPDPLQGPGNMGNAMFAYGGIHDAADDGRLDAKVLLKQATPYTRQILKKNIASVHQERQEMSKEVRNNRVMVLPEARNRRLPQSSSE